MVLFMAFAIYARNTFLDSLWQEKIHDYQKPAATPGGASAICASACAVAFSMEAVDAKSDIVLIWDNAIGQSNVSA